MNEKFIKTKEELKNLSIKLKYEGKKIIATSGCFDLIHIGHVKYLSEAKSEGDVLIVFLNSDESVKFLKGDNRPIINDFNRAVVLSRFSMIDYIYIFNDTNPCECLEILQPDIFAKGEDYASIWIPEMDIVNQYGGIIKYFSMVDNNSTTKIINKIKGENNYDNGYRWSRLYRQLYCKNVK